MGNDQRNVPLIIQAGKVQPLLPRAPFIMVLAFLFLCLSNAVSQSIPSRCGFGTSQTLDQVQKARVGIQARQRPSLPFFRESEDGRFRVHYTLTGGDAVPTTDINSNYTPDYVDGCLDALLHAWRTEVDTLGYVAPPNDGTDGGSPAIDIYLLDLSKAGAGGTSLYGSTMIDRLISSVLPERFTTWIEIDNDFSAQDVDRSGLPSFATLGIDGLRVTCAHELHHVIQNGSYGNAQVEYMFYELTSTWMEMRTFPQIRDWVAYTSRLLESPSQWPMSDPSAATGYVWGWFGNALDLQNSNLLRDAWDALRNGSKPFTALATACSAHGSSLANIFVSAIPVLYHTGSRALASPILPGAEDLPEIQLFVDEVAKEPSALVGGTLTPYEVRCHRFSVQSFVSTKPISVAIITTWPNTSAMISSLPNARIDYQLILTNRPTETDIPIPGSTWGVRVLPEDVVALVDGTQTVTASAPYPQPVSMQQDRTVYIPVHAMAVGENFSTSIASIQSVVLFSGTASVILDANRLVVPIELPGNLAPGTYIVSTESGGQRSQSKIVVQR